MIIIINYQNETFDYNFQKGMLENLRNTIYLNVENITEDTIETCIKKNICLYK